MALGDIAAEQLTSEFYTVPQAAQQQEQQRQ